MTRQQYTPEFKRRAVALLVESGKPVALMAQELDIKENTLYNGVAAGAVVAVGVDVADGVVVAAGVDVAAGAVVAAGVDVAAGVVVAVDVDVAAGAVVAAGVDVAAGVVVAVADGVAVVEGTVDVVPGDVVSTGALKITLVDGPTENLGVVLVTE